VFIFIVVAGYDAADTAAAQALIAAIDDMP